MAVAEWTGQSLAYFGGVTSLSLQPRPLIIPLYGVCAIMTFLILFSLFSFLDVSLIQF